MIKKVIAPVRIDFAGGTTDIYPFTELGGAVLNAAINKYVYGTLSGSNEKISLEYHADVPTSSGLGTSGVMTLVWLALISNEKNKIKLAEQVYKIEQSQGQTGGKQDQYAGALGGINFLEFNADKVKVIPVKLKGSFLKDFENNLVLYYTKKPHIASKLNSYVIDNLMKGKITNGLMQIRDIAKDMKKALENKDLSKFGDLMNDELNERRKLHQQLVGKIIDKYVKIGLRNGAIGAKVCGAGGGGSILFLCANKRKLMNSLPGSFSIKFDHKGLRWI